MLRSLFAAVVSLLALTAAAPVLAQQAPMAVQAQGKQFFNIASSVTTRSANTTQYAANTTVCAAACVAGTIAIPPAQFAGQPGLTPTGYPGQGGIASIRLLKSGSATTAANFTLWFYAAAPGLTSPTQNDGTAYTGPRAADMPNYIGNAVCNTPIATSDTSAQVWFDCTLSNPNTAGALWAQWVRGTEVNYLISTTATYTPANAETFQAFASGFY